MSRDARRMTASGYSLVEFVSVMVIIGVGLAAVIQMFEVGLVSDKVVRWRTTALNLAQQEVELTWATPYADIVSKSRATVAGFSGYDTAVTVTTPQANLKQIRVTCYWTGLADKEMSVELVAYRANVD
jgi:Tfp pilus assembly protein PilV